MQVIDRSTPFRFGYLHFTDKTVQVLNHRVHDLLEPGVRILRPNVEDDIGRVFFSQIAHWSVSGGAGWFSKNPRRSLNQREAQLRPCDERDGRDGRDEHQKHDDRERKGAGSFFQELAFTLIAFEQAAPRSALSMCGATSTILKRTTASGHSIAPETTPVFSLL